MARSIFSCAAVRMLLSRYVRSEADCRSILRWWESIVIDVGVVQMPGQQADAISGSAWYARKPQLRKTDW